MACNYCKRNYWRSCTGTSICFFLLIQVLSGYLFLHFGKEYQLQYSEELNNITTKVNLYLGLSQKENRSIFSNNDTFTLQDDTNIYFKQFTVDLTCYITGTDFVATKIVVMNNDGKKNVTNSCICKRGYYGEDCGIPDAIWHSRYRKPEFTRLLKRRAKPRRIINGLPVLKEIDMLETRFNELGDAVDLFMLGESNFSAHGDHKELYILKQLENGFLKEFHHKILHVFVDFFPAKGKTESWIADEYLRVYMGKLGIPRVAGVRDDDLFIISDADEIPSRPVIMFLKLYDGYTEPVAFVLRWSIYGFFWKSKSQDNLVSNLFNWKKEATTTVYAVTSMGVLRDVHKNDPFLIRKIKKYDAQALLSAYERKHPGTFDPWEAGSAKHYAGWHCSWCFNPEGIVLKLDSAQAGDMPRWGDYPEKHDKNYLQSLIRDGRWFDGSKNMFLANPKEKYYAPPYMIKHSDKFASILFHPKQRKMLSQLSSRSSKNKQDTTKSGSPSPKYASSTSKKYNTN
uniref:Beta-1,4-mannosyl-glycoprotein 4-beta-N-acetylglucosaminyltransferase-like n=1 Tax=Hirondellea gigas TaxID=1518452 RepID=A0A2P2I0F2_9CRUS